jgi:hypothetical protein
VTLRDRVARRACWQARRALVRVAGRELVCADCGRPIGRAIAFGWRGGVKLYGAREINVRVAFGGRERIEFRHLELDRCPSQDRPWVS